MMRIQFRGSKEDLELLRRAAEQDGLGAGFQPHGSSGWTYMTSAADCLQVAITGDYEGSRHALIDHPGVVGLLGAMLAEGRLPYTVLRTNRPDLKPWETATPAFHDDPRSVEDMLRRLNLSHESAIAAENPSPG